MVFWLVTLLRCFSERYPFRRRMWCPRLRWWTEERGVAYFSSVIIHTDKTTAYSYYTFLYNDKVTWSHHPEQYDTIKNRYKHEALCLRRCQAIKFSVVYEAYCI